jgi:small subunit ribosomal protein S6
MNLYEHTIIARQDTSPAQIKQLQQKYTKIVEKNEGDIVKLENWGLMNLSYLIKKNKKGNYIHFKIKADGKTISELEKNEKIDKNLLRYLTVKVKEFDLETDYFKKNSDDKEKEIDKKFKNNEKKKQ